MNPASEEGKKKLGPEAFKSFAQGCIKFVYSMSKKSLDYSPGSLKVVDQVLDDTWKKDWFKGRKIGDMTDAKNMIYTGIVLSCGSYLGEVLNRNLGGRWEQNDHMMFGWCANLDRTRANVFHIAHECLFEPSKFYASFEIARVKAKK